MGLYLLIKVIDPSSDDISYLYDKIFKMIKKEKSMFYIPAFKVLDFKQDFNYALRYVFNNFIILKSQNSKFLEIMNPFP